MKTRMSTILTKKTQSKIYRILLFWLRMITVVKRDVILDADMIQNLTQTISRKQKARNSTVKKSENMKSLDQRFSKVRN